jgi:hypothetical protein
MSFQRNLAASGEEALEKGTGFFGKEACGDCNLVVELGVGQDLKAGTEGAAFGVIGSVNQPGDTGLNNRARAHGAWLECHVERCFRQAVICDFSRSFAEDHDLCVGGWVTVADRTVAPTSQNFITIDKHRTDRDLAGFAARPGLIEGHLHEFLIAHPS